MPADALHYKFIAKEMNEILKNGRIDKITASVADAVQLHIYKDGKLLTVVLSANPTMPRCHLISVSHQNLLPAQPFAVHLKRHITGGRIENILAEVNERILKFQITAKDELGFPRNYVLIAEIMGKHSNLILTNADGSITDCIKHISLDLSSKRQVLPGLQYEPAPTQGKIDPNNQDALNTVIAAYNGDDWAEYLLKRVSGLSPASIAEIVYNAKECAEQDTCCANKLILEFARLFDSDELAPSIRLDENGVIQDFYLKPYHSVKGTYESVASINSAADRYYSNKEFSNVFEGKKNRINAALKASIARNEKRLSLLLDQQISAEDYENERITGEILTANLYRIKPDDKVLIAENYYTDPPVNIEIPLDNALSPAKLAQRHYKRYQKKKKTLDAVLPQIETAMGALDYYEEIFSGLKNAETLADLDEISDELYEYGILKETRNEKKKILKQAGDRLSGVKRTEFEGYLILTGKNNVQNDALVKTSAPHDLWMHTKNIHSAHTVIINPQKKLPPESVIRRAAALTALYSKAAAGENIPVDYTYIKFVSKPKSAAPGKVVYTNQRTVYVTPNK